MRTELENKFPSKRIMITTKDKKNIDCYLIYSNTSPISSKIHNNFLFLLKLLKIYVNESQLFLFLDTDQPLIIFCNPNAGYYEYIYYEVK